MKIYRLATRGSSSKRHQCNQRLYVLKISVKVSSQIVLEMKFRRKAPYTSDQRERTNVCQSEREIKKINSWLWLFFCFSGRCTFSDAQWVFWGEGKKQRKKPSRWESTESALQNIQYHSLKKILETCSVFLITCWDVLSFVFHLYIFLC